MLSGIEIFKFFVSDHLKTIFRTLMTKQTFQATNSLIKQTPSSYFKSNPKIQCSDTSFKVKPTKMLSVCGGRGLRPDPKLTHGCKFLLLLDSFYKVFTVEHTSPDHSTQVFKIRHNGIRQIKQG